MENQKRIVIFEGPSGVGKNAVVDTLVRKHKAKFQKFPSYTTRPMRKGEKNGFHYFFVDEETFLAKRQSGDIFEHTMRHGTYRGIARSAIDAILKTGKIAVKEAVDIHGLHALKSAYPNQVLTIFITADKSIVKARLLKRGDKDINERLADYDAVLQTIGEFDFVVNNNKSIDAAVKEIINIIYGNSNHNA
jgi:guanylate kinase